MKTKLPLSSKPSAKSVIKGHNIFSFLFILLITFSSFGQGLGITFNCGTNSITFGEFDGRDVNGFPYWSNGSDGDMLTSDTYTLQVEADSTTDASLVWAVYGPTEQYFRYFYLPVNQSFCSEFSVWSFDNGVSCSSFSVTCTPDPDPDVDGDGFSASIDCNDNDASIYSGAPEDPVAGECDGLDNNCNGEIDEGLTNCGNDPDNDGDGFSASVDCDDNDATEFPGQTWYLGVDNDGDTYFGSQLTADCENPGGYSLTPPTIDDCDDNDNTVNTTTTYYVDADGDGFGDMNDLGTEYCDDPGVGFSLNNNDCDDAEIDSSQEDCYKYCNDKKTKVIMCHNGKDICVSVNAIDAHLAHGCELGSCISGKISNNVDEIIDEGPTTFDVAFWPNPSNNTFNVKMITPNGNEKVSIKAFDINGRLVHSNTINGNQNYKFGNNLSAGIYMVKLTQESTTKMIKLVKQ